MKSGSGENSGKRLLKSVVGLKEELDCFWVTGGSSDLEKRERKKKEKEKEKQKFFYKGQRLKFCLCRRRQEFGGIALRFLR